MNFFESVHGGADSMGVAAHDFSTNANSVMPPWWVIEKIQQANIQSYPDPHYFNLRKLLAKRHQVDPGRILITGSSSEFIYRVTAYTSRQSILGNSRRLKKVWMPPHSYGDYRMAAVAWGLQDINSYEGADLVWLCDPSSPLGQKMENLSQIISVASKDQIAVLDCAYEPLRLEGTLGLSQAQLDKVWQMWSPNKALGMTGIRGSYVIAPIDSENTVQQLVGLASSWVLSAQGVELLSVWSDPQIQDWQLESLSILRKLKVEQIQICRSVGWNVLPSICNFFCVKPPIINPQEYLLHLRKFDIKLRDTTSFGLPGYFRMAVLPIDSQKKLLDTITFLTGVGNAS